MEDKFTVIGPEGQEIECELLFTFDNPDTGKSYIVYTDGSEDEEGNTVVLASVYDPTGENPALMPIETDAEWEMIEMMLEQLQDQIDDGE